VALPAFSEAARSNDTVRLRALYDRFRLIIDIALLFICGLLWVISPLIIHWLYDERYAEAGNMMAVLSLSFFILRYGVAHQAWLALGLTKYQAMDNIIRAISLWVLLPLLLAVGGVKYAIWGVALHTFPTLVLIVYVNRRVGLFNLKRELAVLPMVLVGVGFGELVLGLANWL
jgi:O-antigen/teichoic acid export membrane protein